MGVGMKPKTIIPLVIGLGVGVIAIKMGLDMVQKAKGDQGLETLVCVSAKQIEMATRITESMIRSTQVPAALVPSNAFTDPKNIVGRVTSMTVAPGVTITNHMLAPPGSEPGLRAIIPKGHRAVSVSVTEESSVAGFITPGSRVDVSTVSERDGNSKLILTNIEVGAVGQSLGETSADGKGTRITKSVTLFLEPQEVQILNSHTAGRTNRVRLALRGNNEDASENFWAKLFQGSRKNQMLPPEDLMAGKATPKQQHVVEVLHGEDLERLVFDDSGLVSRSGRSGTSATLPGRLTAPKGAMNVQNPSKQEVLE